MNKLLMLNSKVSVTGMYCLQIVLLFDMHIKRSSEAVLIYNASHAYRLQALDLCALNVFIMI